MSQDKAPAWVVPVMRAGYAARAATYLVVGILALLSAIYGGQSQGTTNALADLRSLPVGVLALWCIGLGLLAYMLWRLIDAAMDLDDHGHDGKGTIARIGLVVTGLVHGAVGASVIGLAMGDRSSGGGTESLVANLMAVPFGRWLVGLVGVCVVGAGIYYCAKGLRETYKENIRVSETTQKLDPVMKFGFVAEGIVVGIVGALILYAALTTNASQAGGIGEALGQIRSLVFGRILLGVIAVGLIAFAVENLVEAVYRIVPRRAGSDTMTLARQAKAKADEKARRAAS